MVENPEIAAVCRKSFDRAISDKRAQLAREFEEPPGLPLNNVEILLLFQGEISDVADFSKLPNANVDGSMDNGFLDAPKGSF